MRGTRAKLIRGLVEKSLGHLPLVAYEDKKHKPVLFETRQLHEDGTFKKVVVDRFTRRLSNCQRENVQFIKRHWHTNSYN